MKLEEVILRDTRANQPLATNVPEGSLYYVTDESVTERSNGTTWDDFSDIGSGGGVAPSGGQIFIFGMDNGEQGEQGPPGPIGLTGAAGGGGGGGAWTQIAQVIAAAAQTSIDFNSIPNTYNTLKLLWMAQDATGGGATSLVGLRLAFNGDATAGNYTSGARVTSSNGSALMSDVASDSNGLFVGWLPPAIDVGCPFTGEVTIVGYKSTVFHKNVIGTTGGFMTSGPPTRADGQFTGRWKSTAAINAIKLVSSSGLAFVDGSTFTLYGIN